MNDKDKLRIATHALKAIAKIERIGSGGHRRCGYKDVVVLSKNDMYVTAKNALELLEDEKTNHSGEIGEIMGRLDG